MKKKLKEPIASRAKEFELQYKYIKERENLLKYVHQLIDKIEDRIAILESQQK
jgi:hypothetical protein